MASVFDCSLCGKHLAQPVEEGSPGAVCPSCLPGSRPAPAVAADPSTDDDDRDEPDDEEAPARPRRKLGARRLGGGLRGKTIRPAGGTRKLSRPGVAKGPRRTGVGGARQPSTLRGPGRPRRASDAGRAKDEASSDASDAPGASGTGRAKGRRAGARGRAAGARSAPASGAPTAQQYLRKEMIGLVVVLAVIGLFSVTFGVLAHDRGYDKVRNGMRRAQVIQLMGEPDLAIPLGELEVLLWEASSVGTRRNRGESVVYAVTLDGGVVVEKERKRGYEIDRSGG